MKKTILIILGLATSFCLGVFVKTSCTTQPESKVEIKPIEKKRTPKVVTGISGIFFKCKDPKKVKEWYKAHLGMNMDNYGARFEWTETTDTSRRESIQWAAFSEKTSYFNPSTKQFMINYRVEDLAGLVEQLKKDSVIIADKLETYEYGKFIHIMDIEGNKIELFEPNYDYGKTNKSK